jgi:hypothetical protein
MLGARNRMRSTNQMPLAYSTLDLSIEELRIQLCSELMHAKASVSRMLVSSECANPVIHVQALLVW